MASKTHYRAVAANGQQPLFMPTSGWTPPMSLPTLKGRKRIAVDLETKDPELKTKGPGWRRDARIVGLAVGIDGGDRFYLPVGHQGGGNLDERLVRAWAVDELNSFDGEVVGASLNYDLDGLANWGVTFPLARAFHDVQVAEPLLDEWRDEFNLDAISKDYLGGEGKDEALLKECAAAFGIVGRDNIKINLWRYPASMVGPYAEADVDRPLRIFPLQEAKLREEELWPLYDQVERRLIPILVAMRRRGVRISVEKAHILRKRLVIMRDEQLQRLKRLAGAKAEFMEPESFYKSLEERGITVPRTPKTGAPSINKFLLERHEDDELVKCIQEGRKANTMINTFVDGQILGHQINGRIHPTFNQMKGDDGGTIARFSGSNPNLQFIPARDAELAPLVRGIFLPEEGEEWQRDDLSQIQFRLLANYAVGQGAEEARQAYRDNPKTDFHKLTANMLGADPEDKIRRKRVKNTNFAKVFGAQVPRLAVTFGCSLEEAEAFMKEYETKLPFVSKTFDRAGGWGQKRGYVVTILNRRQRFPFWGPKNYRRKGPTIPFFRSREEAVQYWIRDGHTYKKYPVKMVERLNTYMALNRKMQGSEGDLVKKWIVDTHEAGITQVLGPMLITVHDENNNSVPRTKAGDEAGKEFARLGEVAIQMKVPVLVDSQRDEDWGRCG